MRPDYYGFNFVGGVAIAVALTLIGGPLLTTAVACIYFASVLVADRY
jgi:hypothetical protein